jgi:hypothetical protein
MTETEKIIEYIRVLPESVQQEVLDFAEYLGHKTQENSEWSTFSLTHAMRGMEAEVSPYTKDDLKELFT